MGFKYWQDFAILHCNITCHISLVLIMSKKVIKSLPESKSHSVISPNMKTNSYLNTQKLSDSSQADSIFDKPNKYQLWESIVLQTLMLLIPISVITGMIVGAWGALIVCSLGMPLTLVYLKLSHLAQKHKERANSINSNNE